jgi:chromosome segregation ATPase
MFYRSLLISSFIIPPILGGMISCVRTPDVPATPSPSTSVEAQSQLSLSQLNTKRISLLREQETLSARETELESFIGAVQSQDVGERQQREQLRTELRAVQERQTEIQLELDTLVTAQNQVTSQSTNNVLKKQDLEDLQLQIEVTQSELNRLIEDRNQLRSQVIAGNTNPDAPVNSIFQTELSSLNTEISAKIDDLEALGLKLSTLVNNVTSQGTESSGASQSDLEAEAVRLRAEIETKSAAVAELERKIKALINQLDFVAIDQREAFEAQKERLEADLKSDRENLARIEAQLN